MKLKHYKNLYCFMVNGAVYCAVGNDLMQAVNAHKFSRGTTVTMLWEEPTENISDDWKIDYN